MSAYAGPNLAINGLIATLDAGNLKSYSGAGASWSNPTGTYAGSLINGTTFLTNPNRFETNATLVTDANYISLAPQITFNDQTAYSLNFWVKLRPSAASTYHSLTGRNSTTPWLSVFTNNTTGSNWYVRYRQSGGVYTDFSAVTDYNIQTNWTNICLTIDTNRNVNFYLNGIFKQTQIPATTLFYVSILAGGYSSGGNFYALQGALAFSSIYSRTLSTDEVNQNFNALRGRFSL